MGVQGLVCVYIYTYIQYIYISVSVCVWRGLCVTHTIMVKCDCKYMRKINTV